MKIEEGVRGLSSPFAVLLALRQLKRYVAFFFFCEGLGNNDDPEPPWIRVASCSPRVRFRP